VLPDIPTVGDFLPGFEASTWNGVGAPRNTPAEIVDKLNKEFNAVLADPKIKARLADVGGGTVLGGSAADFGRKLCGKSGPALRHHSPSRICDQSAQAQTHRGASWAGRR